MKALAALFCVVAVLAATGVAVSQTVPDAPSASPSHDVAYDQFLGTWHCKTGAGSDVTMVFSLNAANDLGQRLSWTYNGASGWAAATFHHDLQTGSWTTSNTSSNGWTYVANSDGFKGPTIIFTGTQRTPQGDVPTRESFTMFSSGDAFQHHWQTPKKRSWSDTSAAVCERA